MSKPNNTPTSAVHNRIKAAESTPANVPSAQVDHRTTAEREERDRALRLALRAQERPPTPSPERQAASAAFLRVFEVLERGAPSATERAATAQQQATEAARRAHNARGDQARREHAERVRASGYLGWAGEGVDG